MSECGMLNLNIKSMKTNNLQRTKEWYADRRGKATASKFNLLMAKRGLGKTAQDYALQIAGDSLIEVYQEEYQSMSMKRGAELEPYGIKEYEVQTFNDVAQVGFIPHSTIDILGCSPDGLVGEDGMIELKCPEQPNHIKYLASKNCPEEHYDQVQGQLFITGRKWCDFVSYNPDFKEGYKLKVIRVYPDLEWVVKFKDRVEEFGGVVSAVKKGLGLK